jgi:peptide/nickel transport system permease protein
LRILRTQGWGKPQHLILPILALAPPPVAVFARYMRASLISVLGEEYVRTGYAKGGTSWRIVLRHGLRNGLIPVMTVAGPEFAFLMMGTTWVESWFNIPGLGRVITSSGRSNPSMLVLATAFLGLLVMVMNLFVDIGYAILDPRIRVGFALGKTEI